MQRPNSHTTSAPWRRRRPAAAAAQCARPGGAGPAPAAPARTAPTGPAAARPSRTPDCAHTEHRASARGQSHGVPRGSLQRARIRDARIRHHHSCRALQVSSSCAAQGHGQLGEFVQATHQASGSNCPAASASCNATETSGAQEWSVDTWTTCAAGTVPGGSEGNMQVNRRCLRSHDTTGTRKQGC